MSPSNRISGDELPEVVGSVSSEVMARVEHLISECADPDLASSWLLCGRHPRDAVAFTIIDSDLDSRDLTFGELDDLATGVQAKLIRLGVGPGDRVASLMGKGPDLLAVILGIWRLGAVYVPLFTAFGPQAIALRLTDTNTRVVVVDPDQAPKLAPSDDIPANSPWQVVPVGSLAVNALPTDHQLVLPRFASGPDWPLVHMLTSGTTGRPKGVVHCLPYVAGWEAYLEFGLDVRAADVFWCAADPGWAYGLYTAIVAPMALGFRSYLVEGGFSAETTFRVLERFGITNFAAAPTAYRAMRTAEAGAFSGRLRRASSAGEPLTPEINDWARDVLGVSVFDHFGQTETGMTIANPQHETLRHAPKPGCMGSPLPGWKAVVLENDHDAPAPAGELGRIAIDLASSPLMTFNDYHGNLHSDKLTPDGRWYLTGDTGRQDDDGDFHFAARDDDVIIMAGYRIGPFDIESVLVQHPAVNECAVIAIPDELRGEVIEAVIVLRAPHSPSDELITDLQRFVKDRYAAYAYPRSVRFVEALPKTPSGKIQRFLLRNERTAEPAQ
jgi:acetyl-CoA synthetase